MKDWRVLCQIFQYADCHELHAICYPPEVDSAMEPDRSDRSRLKVHEAKAAETVPILPAPVFHHHVKILVAGESGLGKTTCMNNLFRQYAAKDVVDRKHQSGCTICSTPAAGMIMGICSDCSCPELEKSTEAIIEHEEFTIEYSGKDVAHFTLVDTPGYGNDPDFESSILRIEDYIEKQNIDFESKDMLRGRARRIARGDARVTFVLYFIAPHRLKGIDISFFNRIRDLVPVIAIIAKADTMTLEELKEFKHEVATKLNLIQSDVYNWNENGTSDSSTDKVAKIHKLAPFAVISSKKSENRRGFHYPIREYPWGICEAMNPEHSDLAQLKEELFSGSFRYLQEEKEEYYCRWQDREAETELLRGGEVNGSEGGKRRILLQVAGSRSGDGITPGG
eukprot:TRINITY_DN4413_c0_g1_i1.p1 TRINITY_DN4413_c0_g1~~TRINITY_DN4413_c0_g1_i1.p1  ORF type:complete len:394 (+),score=71.57 TRINITY_DN4413_c0_g1_i1:746-1927(+)